MEHTALMYSTAYNLWTFTWFVHFELPFRLKGTEKIHTEILLIPLYIFYSLWFSHNVCFCGTTTVAEKKVKNRFITNKLYKLFILFGWSLQYKFDQLYWNWFHLISRMSSSFEANLRVILSGRRWDKLCSMLRKGHYFLI